MRYELHKEPQIARHFSNAIFLKTVSGIDVKLWIMFYDTIICIKMIKSVDRDDRLFLHVGHARFYHSAREILPVSKNRYLVSFYCTRTKVTS